MSLIDEALKRARQEAERREAVQRSAASRWVPSHPLARRRSRALLWAGGAVVCLAAGVAVGLTFSSLVGDDAAKRERPAARQPASAAAPAAGEEPQVGKEAAGALLEDLVTEPLPPSPPGPPPIAAGPPPVGPQATAAGQQPPSLPSPSSAAETAEPQGAPAPTAGQPPPPRGSVHVHRAPLPGGGSIELGGIAFSATQPVALLNGKVVGVGEIVDGMTVVAIHPKRVDLEGRGVALSVLVE